MKGFLIMPFEDEAELPGATCMKYDTEFSQGKPSWFIQCYFSLLKSSTIDLASLAKKSNALTEDQHSFLQTESNGMKIEKMLKILLRRGEAYCQKFVHAISNVSPFDGLIQTFKNESVPMIADDTAISTTKETLQKHLKTILENLQVSKVLDGLFECDVISLNDHDQVQENKTRPAKRKCLMEILFAKADTCWVKNFAKVLRLSDWELYQILETGGTQTQQDPEIQGPLLGHTSPIPEDYVARLSSDNPADMLPEISNGENAEQILQECIGSGLIDIWNGSIYLHICTFYPEVMDDILSGRDLNRLIKLLQQLFKADKNVLTHLSQNRRYVFELWEKPSDVFIDERYGKSTTYLERDDCSECFLATIRHNYNIVKDEIEDDIIEATFKRFETEQNRLDKIWIGPRRVKAMKFLQYVMSNKKVLMEFKTVFRSLSQVQLQSTMCYVCSGKGALVSRPRNATFYFTVSLDNAENVQIQLNEIVTNTGRKSIQKIHRGLSVAQLTLDSQGSKHLRTVVMQNTHWEEGRTSFCESVKETDRFMLIQMPNIVHKAICKEEEYSIVNAIALTLPGPHAFILITDIRRTNLYETLSPYKKYFGPNIMQYLVLVIVADTNGKTREDIIAKSAALHLILNECEDRFIIFDPKSSAEDKLNKIDDLVQIIKMMLMKNKEPFYSNVMLRQSEKEVQRQENALKKEKQKTIKDLERQIRALEQDDSRAEAARQITSQKRFLDILNFSWQH